MTTGLFVLAAGLLIYTVVFLARWLEAGAWRRSLVAFRLRLPRDLSADDVARWLGHLSTSLDVPRLSVLPHPPVALEIRATAQGISHYLFTPASLRATILAGLRASLPGVRVDEVADATTIRQRCTLGAELTMTAHRRPLAHDRAEAASAALLAALQPLSGSEIICVQWIMTGGGVPPVARQQARGSEADLPWWLDDTASDAESVRAERLKHRELLLRAVVRLAVTADSPQRRAQLLGKVRPALRTLNSPGVRLVRRWWLPERTAAERLHRFSLPLATWPLVLNVREAAGLVGLPLGELHLPGLSLGSARQLPAPVVLPTRGAIIGRSNYPGTHRPLALRTDDRLRHLHVIGPTGVGKSTLLANLALQDITAGHGLVLVDPKGDLVSDVLARVPDERARDVIVLEPSEPSRPVGFNPLAVAGSDAHQRELVADQVLGIFRSLYRAFWGPRTDDILRAVLLTLAGVRAPDGSAFTICEVPELLTNPALRRIVTSRDGLPEPLRLYWRWFESLSDGERLQAIGPVLNKLRAFTMRSSLRLVLGQSQGLDLPRLVRSRGILLVSLAKGRLGSETANLLGSLLVVALWQAILGRVRLEPQQRRPFFVYLDEFQDVLRMADDLADMLAQARGLGAGLVLAHQYFGQLPEQLKTAVLGTVRSQIAFQVEHDDARVLEKRFGPALTATDLMGLDAYEVALRPCVDGKTLAPVTGTTLPLPEALRDGAELAVQSQERHGLPRADVEAGLEGADRGGAK